MLLDDLLAASGARADAIRPRLGSCLVIKAQNVVDYLYMGTPTEEWEFKDFPNVAPPAPDLWFEWNLPRQSNSEGKIVDFSQNPKWVPTVAGVHLWSVDRSQSPPHEKPPWPTEWGPGWPDKVRWFSMGSLYARRPQRMGWLANVAWWVEEEGGLRPISERRLGYSLPDGVIQDEEQIKEAIHFAKVMMFVPWLALSFLHCKNVQLVKGPAHSPELQKARQNRGRPRLVRWHTLVIEPVKRVVASANAGNPELSPKALHICRGHFKDFTERGLFGKLHGVYWWPMHARGEMAKGFVGKDYDVKPTVPTSAG